MALSPTFKLTENIVAMYNKPYANKEMRGMAYELF